MKRFVKSLSIIIFVGIIAYALFALVSFLGYHFCHIKRIDIINNSEQAHTISLVLGKQNVIEKLTINAKSEETKYRYINAEGEYIIHLNDSVIKTSEYDTPIRNCIFTGKTTIEILPTGNVELKSVEF